MHDFELANVVASRICHDLVGPVGAVVNGVDLIREIGVGDVEDELGMVGQSGRRAADLLQFYRIAFGAAAPEDTAIKRDVLNCLAGMFVASDRVMLSWPSTRGPDLSRQEARLLFQMLMCARAIAGMRGEIGVELAAEASFPLRISIHPHGNGHGGPARLNAEMVEIASAPDQPPLTPRLIEFSLVRISADALGVTLGVAEVDGAVTLLAED